MKPMNKETTVQYCFIRLEGEQEYSPFKLSDTNKDCFFDDLKKYFKGGKDDDFLIRSDKTKKEIHDFRKYFCRFLQENPREYQRFSL